MNEGRTKARVIAINPYLDGWKRAKPFRGFTTNEWLEACESGGRAVAQGWCDAVLRRQDAEVALQAALLNQEAYRLMVVGLIEARVLAEMAAAEPPRIGFLSRLRRALDAFRKGA